MIRRMTGAHLASVADIEREYHSPWTPAQLAAELDYSGGEAYILQDDDGKVVGWCCARVQAGEAELLKIAVLPQIRGRGKAAMLLDHLLYRCRNTAEVMFLEVRSRNRSAISFYLKHGFTQVGERPGYYTDPDDTGLIFRKDLQ